MTNCLFTFQVFLFTLFSGLMFQRRSSAKTFQAMISSTRQILRRKVVQLFENAFFLYNKLFPVVTRTFCSISKCQNFRYFGVLPSSEIVDWPHLRVLVKLTETSLFHKILLSNDNNYTLGIPVDKVPTSKQFMV